MKKYNPKAIEKKWQKVWFATQIFTANNQSSKEKRLVLAEFPYPSGAGLHMGHLRPYVAGDTYSRFLRMRGYEVMFPIGWDAFGLPAENYAIKNKVAPRISTAQNIKNAKKQVQSWGIGFDWSREVNTTDPAYYKWTQWIFLQLYKHGLAYEATGFVNWCPSCKTGLANEEVIDGKCERCHTTAEQKELRQWYLKITAYAEQLLDGLQHLPQWPNAVKVQQENWIGRSEGINIAYQVEGLDASVTIFTTRPDTNFGATFIVAAPDDKFVAEHIHQFPHKTEVEAYVNETKNKSEIERLSEGKKKTGVFTGLYAINQLNNKKLPIYVGDFALGNVGTGVLVGVPGHDMRDFEFAQAMGIEIVRVVVGPDGDSSPITRTEQIREEAGTMINSEFLDGLDIHEATNKIMDYIEEKGWGKRVVNYKLRDWVFSRQRYWGEPIPLVHCKKCGIVPVPENELPVVLPKVRNYEPTGTGESPLAIIKKWVNTKCPQCCGRAKRETNTMPQWAGSSWYYLRYTDPKNDTVLAGSELLKHWLPVDVYFGGMEHTTLHLLYSRFWNLFLNDIGVVPVKEPYTKRVPHGIVLASDGEKMSKSRGNVVNPDDVVKEHGADTLRMYEMFLGPHDASVAWNNQGIIGVRRFLDRAWKIVLQKNKNKTNSIRTLTHQTVKKITEDIENFRFNTCVSQLMILVNDFEKAPPSIEEKHILVKLLSPLAPHIAEELWHALGHEAFIINESWPSYDESKLLDETVTISVQFNGKFRGTVTVPRGTGQNEVLKLVQTDEKLKKYLTGDPKKLILVPDRLLNVLL